jgi:hypothetical protein
MLLKFSQYITGDPVFTVTFSFMNNARGDKFLEIFKHDHISFLQFTLASVLVGTLELEAVSFPFLMWTNVGGTKICR